MDIAVVGAGLTGLTAAYRLTRQGHHVTVIERDAAPGGLAAGFTAPGWEWPLEKAYHHFFTGDRALLDLIGELGMAGDVILGSPATANLWHGTPYRFDTPSSVLSFPGMPFPDRVRTGMVAALAKINPFWQPLETITAKRLFTALGGTAAWDAVWGPLMTAKFGDYAPQVASSWLWARLHSRSMRLGYIQGGFQSFVDALSSAVAQNGATVLLGTSVTGVTPARNGAWNVSWKTGTRTSGKKVFDRVLLTVPSVLASHMAPFPEEYARTISSIPHLWAQCLILETDAPVLENTYWLSVTDPGYPFLAVVAHTNFIDRRHYGNRHLTYVGNYLPEGHRYLKMDKTALLREFTPDLKRISPAIRKGNAHILRTHLFTAPFAQPVHTLRYSRRAPAIKTPVVHLYLANLDSIYPWDRGTNYAVDLGNRAASVIAEA